MGAGLLAYDLIFLSLATVLYGVAALAFARVLEALSAHVPWWLALVPALVVAVVALIAQVSILTALCPRLEPGRYPLMKGPVFYAWLVRSMLRRTLMVPGLRFVILSSNVLRFLALRGLGARVAFASNMSNDVDVLDPSLLEVGAGATIGARCIVSGHYVKEGKLVLGTIRVGDRALLALDVAVGPGTTIGEDAVLHAKVSLSVGVTIGAGARIGGGAVIDTKSTVGAHARVATRSYLPPRTVVPDHGSFPAPASAGSTDSSAAPAV
jgi:carbonic anhydrase/acetyltransferase-like protein (isoleucine patch superfamily)